MIEILFAISIAASNPQQQWCTMLASQTIYYGMARDLGQDIEKSLDEVGRDAQANKWTHTQVVIILHLVRQVYAIELPPFDIATAYYYSCMEPKEAPPARKDGET